MRTSFLFLFILMAQLSFCQQAHFSWSGKAKACLNSIYNLELDQANTQIDAIKNQDPNNLVYHLLANYVDFLYLSIQEDRAYLNDKLPLKNERIEALDALPDSNPYKAYAQAEIMVQWAMVRFRFEEYFQPLLDLNKALKKLKKIDEAFPYFMPAKKTLGTLYVGIGSIPPTYQSIIGVISAFDGDIDTGFDLVQTAYQHGKDRTDYLFHRETGIILAYLTLYIKKDRQKAWQLAQELGLDTQESPLARFVVGNLALRSMHNDDALDILQAPMDMTGKLDIAFLDFMLGEAYLFQLDPRASRYFEQYMASFEGQNYIKEALQKTAWSYLVQGDQANYQKTMQRIVIEGESYSASDKSALLQAQKEKQENVSLLKARLLCDGGYFQRADKILQSDIPDAQLLEEEEQLEYYYRKGRIAHLSKKLSNASTWYLKTIELGAESERYFACRAALELGYLYEEKKEPLQAEKYFRLCLDIHPSEYKLSLHSAAKAGLRRI